MKITITGKELQATEAIKDYVEKKVKKIEKYFSINSDTIEVNVTIRVEKNVQIAEMFVFAKGENFKAVTEDKDLYSSIDKDIDILEGQIRKTKTKKEKLQKDASIKQITINGDEEANIEGEIIKSMYYSVKPITPEDAILKLQEKSMFNFLVFINIETNKVNVIFKLKDGKNYGIIEPEA
ncbi:MAG: ribosome-associated translation inhibitor RaiA [Clostridia bacterium]|nr:ribosome-associated translation inhibitor RaiA [Clostridia bacterium]